MLFESFVKCDTVKTLLIIFKYSLVSYNGELEMDTLFTDGGI